MKTPDAMAVAAVPSSRRRRFIRRIALVAVALSMAAVLWLPCLHFCYRPRFADYASPEGLGPKARALATRHLALWDDPARRAVEIRRMRASNAEWDFMARTFFVLALANISLREPELRPRCLRVIDTVIDETLRAEDEQGPYHFLLPYARNSKFVAQAQRSLFLDGEIALMLGARRLLEERADHRARFAERVAGMAAQMAESPVLSGESYPDECWTFCNSIALAALRVSDTLDDTDHSAFLERWVATAKRKLVHARTGLLISSYRFDGTPKDGPEGSSLWTVAHFLSVVDRPFAEEQYRRAEHELAGSILGFGYAREWPDSWRGPADIDSGPIVPVLDISAGSSGQALLGAMTFDDPGFALRLLTSLALGGFPIERQGELRFAASNAVGDAVVLYALTQGPLWRELERRGKAQR
jgi:hypothetical protein